MTLGFIGMVAGPSYERELPEFRNLPKKTTLLAPFYAMLLLGFQSAVTIGLLIGATCFAAR